MAQTQGKTRTLAAAAGAVLALGAGALSMGPASAATAHAAAPTHAQASKQATAVGPLALVRSATHPTTYYLKAQSSRGIGEVPAPDAQYRVTIKQSGRTETLTVRSHQGALDLSKSTILKTAKFQPAVSVQKI